MLTLIPLVCSRAEVFNGNPSLPDQPARFFHATVAFCANKVRENTYTIQPPALIPGYADTHGELDLDPPDLDLDSSVVINPSTPMQMLVSWPFGITVPGSRNADLGHR
jgi:hypothetical protein